MKEDSSWVAAQAFRDIMGPFLPAFTTCIRLLRSHPSGEAKNQSVRLALRLLECPSIKVPVYHAARGFQRADFREQPFVTEQLLFDAFRPLEFTSLLALLYLRQKAINGAPKGAIKEVTRQLQVSSNLGMHIGSNIYAIGPSTGLLAGGMREIAMCSFLSIDEKGYRQYRLDLRSKKLPYDLKYELRRWGCTHGHLITLLLVNLGFGVDYAYSFHLGITGADKTDAADTDARKVRVLMAWLSALIESGEPPQSDVGDDYEISDAKVDKLVSHIPAILKSEGDLAWLSKDPKELSADDKVKLFALPASNSAEYASLPPELRKEFTLAAWSELKSVVQNELKS